MEHRQRPAAAGQRGGAADLVHPRRGDRELLSERPEHRAGRRRLRHPVLPRARRDQDLERGRLLQPAHGRRARSTPATAAANKTHIGGSTFYRRIQTDNYYADRRPTPWRGRGLYLPELAIGRLVETTDDIWHYLKAYDSFAFGVDPYIIDATNYPISQGNPRAGAAYVTGYDFVTDEAQKIGDLYEQYGFKLNATLGQTYTLNTLISDTWSQSDLTNTWFNGQLPQLTSSYSGVNTFYHLMSLNGHFTHYSAIPANNIGAFTAQQLYDPTVAAGFERQSYFIDPSGDILDAPSTSLVYSIGCHSGLNVVNGDISAATPQYQYDFPSAALKQGGNWIGNSGFGYGDSDLIAYSEKLALLLTKALGRNMRRWRILHRPNDRQFAGVGQARISAHRRPWQLRRLRREGAGGADAVRPAVHPRQGAAARTTTPTWARSTRPHARCPTTSAR